MKIRFIICLLTIWLPLNMAIADTAADMYLVGVSVPTQSDDIREQAVQTGFKELLIRLSGNVDIDKNPFIKENLNRADYYVQEFSYSSVTTNSSEYTLQIRYAKDDVNRLLKKANMLYWDTKRPLILLWVAVTDIENNTTTLIGNDTDDLLGKSLLDQSKKYGLPMILPLLDVADLDRVSFSDVATMNLFSLQSAAKRYAPDGMLIGRVQKSINGIDSQWVFLLDGQRWNWTLSTTTNIDPVNKIINATLNQLSQVLVENHAKHLVSQPDYWFKLQVSHLTKKQVVL